MRTSLGRTVISAYSWTIFAISLVVWLPMVAVVRLVTAPFDSGRYAAGYLFRKVVVFHQKTNPLWKFTVSGEVPDNPRNPYVVVANHESFVDILLISHLPMEMKWLSKDTFFKIPVVGWLMSLAGDIKLSRGDKSSAAEAIRQCHDRLQKNVSVMIFPEGSRSKTGELQEFKNGAFRMAVDAQVPILPLVVLGTRSALRKDDWRFGDSEAEVRILEPISTDGLTVEDVPELRERVRSIIETELSSMRSERGLPAAS